jgi:hypothetical protein
MAEIFCQACGNVFDVRQSVCTRCGRCPNCGTKHGIAAAHCVECGQPADDQAVYALVQRLDVSQSKNARASQRLQREWENEALLAELSWRGVHLLVIAAAMGLAGIWGLVLIFGLPNFWVILLSHLFVLPLVLGGLLMLVRHRRFRWLLATRAQEEPSANAIGAGRDPV